MTFSLELLNILGKDTLPNGNCAGKNEKKRERKKKETALKLCNEALPPFLTFSSRLARVTLAQEPKEVPLCSAEDKCAWFMMFLNA